MTGEQGREESRTAGEPDASAGEWIPAGEAAARLGVSVRTVQKRASKGEIPSRLEDGRRLIVCLPLREPDATPGESFANVRDSGPEVREPDANRLLDTIARQDSEIQFLRAEVERGRQGESELRRLMLADKSELSELRQRLAILPAAPVSDAVDAPEQSDGKSQANAKPDAGNAAQGQTRHWWKWWNGSR